MAKLDELLHLREAAIAEAWLDALLDTYPPDAGKLLKDDRNRFTNPVGHILSDGVKGALSAIRRSDGPEIRRHLAEILQVRSVQEMTPARAVAFVFSLKEVARSALGGELTASELGEFDRRVDRAILIAFDIWAECRERICELRVREVKRNVSQILKMSGYADADPDPGGDAPPERLRGGVR